MASSDDSAERPTREQDWAALIRQMAEGDQSALAALYDGTSRLIYGLALRILGDPAMAEEVTIEVYMQAWRQAVSYDPGRGTPLAWLLTLARSRAIDRLRSRAEARRREILLEAAMVIPASTVDPEEASEAAERRRLVQTALTTLTPEQREVIELAYFSGLSHSEIAARFGQPLGTVKTRIRLGMMRLRELLAPLGERR